MSLKGPIDRWKNRQSSHSGSFLNRPKTAAPDNPDPNAEFRKLIENAVLDAFNSDVFREAVASQVEPSFVKQQEKLNQLRSNSLNLESGIEGLVEHMGERFGELVEKLDPALSHVVKLVGPAEYENDFASLFHGQHVFLEKFDGIGTQLEHLPGQDFVRDGFDKLRVQVEELPRYEEQLTTLRTGQDQGFGKLSQLFVSRLEKMEKKLEGVEGRVLASQGRLEEGLGERFERRMDALELQIQGVEEMVNSVQKALEEQIDGVDTTVKSYQDELHHSDLRTALRFGELSNELQDRNTMLGNRLTETERGLGKKIDNQQRRVVAACEELRNVSMATQDQVSSLETVQAECIDKLATNEEALKKTKAVTEGMAAKMDKLDRGIRHDIDGLRESVAALDTTPVQNLPRRLDAIDRANVEHKKELEIQRGLAVLDSKILSGSHARIDSLASNVANLTHALEAVDEKVSDESAHFAHMKKLDSLDGKLGWVNNVVERTHKRVNSLDTSTLAVHTKHLEEIASSVAAIDGRTNALDKSITEHTVTSGDLQAQLSRLQSSHDNDLEKCLTAASEHTTTLGTLSTKLVELGTNHQKGLETAVTMHTTSFDDLRANISELQSCLDNATATHTEKLVGISREVSLLPGHTQIDEIFETITATKGTLENSTKSITELQHDAATSLNPIMPMLQSLKERIQNGNEGIELLNSTTEDLVSKAEAINSAVSELRSLDKSDEVLSSLKTADESRLEQATKFQALSSTVDEVAIALDGNHSATMKEFQARTSSILSNLEKSHESNSRDLSSMADSLKSREEQIKTLQEHLVEHLDSVRALVCNAQSDIKSDIESISKSEMSHAEEFKTSASSLEKSLTRIGAVTTDVHLGISDAQTKVASILPLLESSTTSHSNQLASIIFSTTSHEEHIKNLEERLEENLATLRVAISESQNGIAETKANVSAILPILEASTASHSSHKDSFERIIDFTNGHADSLSKLCEESSGTNTNVASILPILEASSASHAAHRDSLERIIECSNEHANSLSKLREESSEIGENVLKSLAAAETHSSSIQILQDSAPRKDDVSSLGDMLIGISATVGRLSTSEDIETAVKSVSKQITDADVRSTVFVEELKGRLTDSHDALTSHSTALSNLSETNAATHADILSASKGIEASVQDVTERINAVDIEFQSSLDLVKSLLGEHKSTIDNVHALVENPQMGEPISQILEQVKASKILLDSTTKRDDTAEIHSRLQAIGEEISQGKLVSQASAILECIETIQNNSQDDKIIRLAESIESKVEKSSASLLEIHEQAIQIEGIQAQFLKQVDSIDEKASLIAPAQAAIAAIDVKMEATEKAVKSTVQELKSIVEKEHMESRSNITATVRDAASTISKDQESLIVAAQDAIAALDSKLGATERVLLSSAEELRLALEKEHTEARSSIKTAFNSTINQYSEKHSLSLSAVHEAVDALESRLGASDESLCSLVQAVKLAVETEHAETRSQLTSSVEDTAAELEASVRDCGSRVDTSSSTVSAALVEIKKIAREIESSTTALKVDLKNTQNALTSEIQGNGSKIETSRNALREDVKAFAKDTGTSIEENRTVYETSATAWMEALKSLDSKLKTVVESHGSTITNSTEALKADFNARLDPLDGVLESVRRNGVETSEKVTALLAKVPAVGTLVTSENAVTKNVVEEVAIDLKSLRELIEQHRKSTNENTTTLTGIDQKVAETQQGMRNVLDEKLPSISKEIAALDVKAEIRQLNQIAESNAKEALEVSERVMETSVKAQKAILDEIEAIDVRAAVKELNELAKTNRKELSDVNEKVAKTSSQISNTFSHEISSLQDKLRDNDAASTATRQGNSKLLASINEFIQQIPEKTENVVAREIGVLDKSVKAFDTAVAGSSSEMERLVQEHGKLLESIQEISSRTETAVSQASKTLDATLHAVNDCSSETTEAISANNTLLNSINKTVEEAPSKMESTMAQEVAALESAMRALVITTGNETVQAVKVTHNLLSEASAVMDRMLNNTADLTNAVETVDSKIVSHTLATTRAAVDSENTSKISTAALEDLRAQISTLRTSLAAVAADVGDSHVPAIIATIESSDSAAAERLESIQQDLVTIKSGLGTNTTAIRVNLAAISRVDKAVLETGAQIKGVVFEGNQKLSTELETLDESINDSGTRIRGISEYDIPRLEESLTSHIKSSSRQHDALAVIGGRIIGTQNKFDEMVEHHSLKGSPGHESPVGRSGRAGSKFYGQGSMGRRTENPLMLGGSGRFRGLSSATRSSSDFSGSLRFKGGNYEDN